MSWHYFVIVGTGGLREMMRRIKATHVKAVLRDAMELAKTPGWAACTSYSITEITETEYQALEQAILQTEGE